MAPHRKCSCRDPQTKRLLGKKCPDLAKKGHGAWHARYEAPPGPDGKRRQPWIGPYKTEKECKEALAKAVAKVAGSPTRTEDTKTKVRAYFDQRHEWRRSEAATGAGLKPKTLAAEREAIDLYINPGLGHLPMVGLTDQHIRDLYAAMRLINRDGETGGEHAELLRRLTAARATRPDGRRLHTRPISEARIRRVHAVLTGGLNDAVLLSGIIDRSPAVGVFRTRGGGRRFVRIRPLLWTDERVERWEATGHIPGRVMVWTPTQTGNFLDFSEACNERLHALFHLDAYWGLRRGELVGLERSEVSLARRWMHVRQSQAEDDLDDTKSDAGDRHITYDEGTAAVLRSERTRQSAERLHWGEAYQDSGRFFSYEDGRALKPGNVSERFGAAITRYGAIRSRLAEGWTEQKIAGRYRVPVAAVRIAAVMPLPPIRFHDLRHGAATMLLAAGVDMKLVADVLGHASANFTRDVYAVVAGELAEAAAVAIEAFVPRRNRREAVRAINVPATGEMRS
ncbi:site-specific integrase [Frankia sp. AgB32]|uniref:site-specific integrase n=1 Tax=Frankia sp. AgB32 TaxID=631119 RepID=UPI00200E2528|nr:site-specific integrase [Frankia sp. AgB32]MCK9894735.1 site-specific integrase [Frankia sp. AgB32]